MRFRIHFEVNGHEDSVEFSGDSIEDIRNQWVSFAEGRPFINPWSEEV